jgi:hypothetical protein
VEPDELLDEREADARALVRADRAPRTRWKRSETRSHAPASGDADPGVRDRELDAIRDVGATDRIAPSNVNLKRVREEVRRIFSHMSRST